MELTENLLYRGKAWDHQHQIHPMVQQGFKTPWMKDGRETVKTPQTVSAHKQVDDHSYKDTQF